MSDVLIEKQSGVAPVRRRPRKTAQHEDVIVHVYDDIEEADNRLPRWWLYTLYGTIVFAVIYWFAYQVYGSAAGPLESYKRELSAQRKAEAARLKAAGAVTPEMLVALAKNPEETAQGAAVYQANCVACHAAAGAGNIGPNLTDKFWIHGGAPEAIYETVRDGVLDKGMPAWGPTLGEDKVRSVTAYVISLKGTNAPGGKAPQGNPEE